MPSAKTISRNKTGFPEYLDFRRLREEGLKHIQQLSGELWTDHNLHDPGITILEVLCYALLDLGYRTNLPITDLLARDKSKEPDDNQFFTAAEILGNNPLTINDFRKLLLDVRGLRNAWLVPADRAEVELELDCGAAEGENQLKYKLPPEYDGQGLKIEKTAFRKPVILNGLYRVLLELDPTLPEDQDQGRCNGDSASVARILQEVKSRLHAYRNLCEDFLDISVLHDEQIGVCAHIEIEPGADPEDVLVAMFERLRDFLSPAVRFYTLQQMLEKGRSMEEIFEGRPCHRESHGFIDTEELEQLELREEIHASDIYNVMLGGEKEQTGIRAISKLLLFNYIDAQAQTTGEEWCLHLTPGYHPILAPELSTITVFKDGIPFSVNLREVYDRYAERLSSAQKVRLQPYELDRAVPEGQFRPIGDYFSIQRDFPAVYGIGEGGLPESASPRRKAQALQLKGYLLFFDQLLANYLAQLAHLRDFFALKPGANGFAIQTYFPGDVSNVPDIGKLIRGWDNAKEEAITGDKTRYRRGETIAIPYAAGTHDADDNYLIFSDPLERDDTIRRVKSAFENEDFVIGALFDAACNRYRFTITLPVDLPDGSAQLVLRSAALYEEESVALREGEALTFLGLGSEHYRIRDDQSAEQYSFEIAYQPRPYSDILDALAESPAAALRRRNSLLDHLLARFAEDFAEYALLQYTLDNKRTDYGKLITTKQNFLADYPDISRNRGKGFDYTDRNRLWDSDNVTGLEKRVSRLMGIGDWKRRTLSPFEVVTKPASKTYQLLDFRGRVIFESLKQYADETAFLDDIEFLAADPNNYRPADCASRSVFGFQLLEKQGTAEECAVAIHPDTYASAAVRDAKADYLAALFGGSVVSCESEKWTLKIETISKANGEFKFSLLKKEQLWKAKPTEKQLVQSHLPFPDEASALEGWKEFALQARDLKNYKLEEEEKDGKKKPILQVLDVDGKKVLFELSPPPADLAAATTAQAEVFKAIVRYHREPSAQQPSSGMTWEDDKNTGLDVRLIASLRGYYFVLEEKNGDGQTTAYAKSLSPYDDEKTALAAWVQFVEQARDRANYHLAPDDYGLKFTPQVLDAEGQPLAVLSEIPLDKSEAEAAQNAVFELIAKHEADNVLAQRPPIWGWQFGDGQGNLLLESLHFFESREQAAIALCSALELASDESNFEKTANPDGTFGFFLAESYPEGEDYEAYKVRIAAPPQPTHWDEQARDAALEKTVCAAQAEAEYFGKIIPKSNALRLLVCDSANNLLLCGVAILPDLPTAQIAWDALVARAQNVENYVVEKGNGLRVSLKNASGEVLAEAPEIFYDEKTALDFVENTARLALLKHLRMETETTGKVFTFRLLDAENRAALTGNTWQQEKKTSQTAYLEALFFARDPQRLRTWDDEEAGIFKIQLLDSNGSVLAESDDFENAETRDAVLADWRLWFAGPGVAPQIVECPGEWYFQVWQTLLPKDENEFPQRLLALESAADYPSREDAALALELTLRAARSEEGYRRTQEDGACRFSFEVIDLEKDKNDVALALHPHWYASEPARDEAIASLIAFLNQNKLPYETPFLDAKWHYELWWESCDEQIEPALVGKTLYPGKQAAQDAFCDMVKALKEKSKTELEVLCQKLKGGYGFSLKNGNDEAAHPQLYPSKEKCEQAIFELLEYVCKKHWLNPIPISKEEGSVFRLRKTEPPIAVFVEQFLAANERDKALAKLASDMACRPPEYGCLDLSCIEIGGKSGEFYFLLQCGGTTLWRSCQTFPTREAAAEAFENQYLDILELTADPENYETACDGATPCYFWLPDPADPEGKRCIARTEDFPPDADLKKEFEMRLRQARMYPIFRNEEGLFCFRIAEPLAGKALWLSAAAYPTAQEARAAFERFLALLPFFENYRKTDDENSCRFGFVLEEAGLEGVDICPIKILKKTVEIPDGGTSGDGDDEVARASRTPLTIEVAEKVPDYDCSWEKLDLCLESFGADSHFFPRYDPWRGCRWSLVWAKDAYRLARSPQVWHTAAKREAAKADLFHKILCSGYLKEDCDSRWFYIGDCERTYLCADLKLLWDSDFGLLQFQEPDPADPCANGDPTRVEVEKIIDLMALARAEECYVKVSEPDGMVALGLLDRQNRLVAKSLAKVAAEPEDEWLALRAAAIAQAWEFPYVRRGDKFGFQLALDQEILLENTLDYNAPFAANAGFCRLLKLLKQKANYASVEPDDCGPFGIEIIDNAEIKATHPTTYAGCDDLQKAINDLTYCLDAEGFHVIEHILLRPKDATEAAPLLYFSLCRNGLPLLTGVKSEPLPTGEKVGEKIEDLKKAFEEKIGQLLAVEPPLWRFNQEGYFELLDGENAFARSLQAFEKECLKEKIEKFIALLKDEENTICCEIAEDRADALFEACANPEDCLNPELTSDCVPGADPYSFWATVAIPWWGRRFRDLNFRQFVEKTLRREAPAHVGLRIGWLSAKDMTELETDFRAWLGSNALGDDSCLREENLNELIEIMKKIRNRYPAAKLQDCGAAGGGDGGEIFQLDLTMLS